MHMAITSAQPAIAIDFSISRLGNEMVDGSNSEDAKPIVGKRLFLP
jgi:hypothetical protein